MKEFPSFHTITLTAPRSWLLETTISLICVLYGHFRNGGFLYCLCLRRVLDNPGLSRHILPWLSERWYPKAWLHPLFVVRKMELYSVESYWTTMTNLHMIRQNLVINVQGMGDIALKDWAFFKMNGTFRYRTMESRVLPLARLLASTAMTLAATPTVR